jgi:IS5 family transposase
MTRSQPTLASTGFEKYTKVTRRAQFLAEMDRVVPWRELCARIEPVYPQPGNGRARRCGADTADVLPATMRAFAGIDLGREAVPDETTVCKFRHLLEQHGLEALFDAVREPQLHTAPPS